LDAWVPATHPLAIEAQLAEAVRRRPVLTVVCIGTDRSGRVRDALGRDGTRHVVAGLADALRGQAPAGSTVGLLDDVHVVVALPLATEDARQWARRAVADGGRTLLLRGRDVPIELAAGLVSARPGSSAVQLLDDAGAALREAVRMGAPVVVHEPGIRRRAEDQLAFESELRRAITGHGLHLAFQPVVELPTRAVVGAEALLRWTTPWGANVPAATTVAVAEQSGLMGALGRWVILQAARHVSPDRWVTVNLSPLQVTDRLPEVVRRALATAPGGGLRFELCHGELPAGAVGILQRVRDLGCRLGISDFGSARSYSLAELLRLPLDFVKLDPSFLTDLDGEERRRTVLRGVGEVARAIGIELIAEGVEREEESALLVELGVHLQQGNLFARPRAEAPVTAG
jgi:EAL domain-containing protein (putative c-di-GMP-specific phosphodiesterase class I)/GGDEF domain-containing protein